MKHSTTLSTEFSRRHFIGKSAVGAGLMAAGPLAAQFANAAPTAAASSSLNPESLAYPFALPELGYGYNALEPAIDAQTMEIHHTKHHAAYVNNLNAALESNPGLHGKTLAALLAGLADLPEEIRTTVRNNGGGHLNHALFWTSLSASATEPSAALGFAIDVAFGSRDKMLDEIAKAGASQFGSGWAWLCKKPDSSLVIFGTPNQDTPIMQDASLHPLLGVDVWEHAYYLRYQNRRADYLAAWRGIVNWSAVSARFETA